MRRALIVAATVAVVAVPAGVVLAGGRSDHPDRWPKHTTTTVEPSYPAEGTESPRDTLPPVSGPSTTDTRPRPSTTNVGDVSTTTVDVGPPPTPATAPTTVPATTTTVPTATTAVPSADRSTVPTTGPVRRAPATVPRTMPATL